MMNGFYHGWGMGFGWLAGIIFLVVLIWLIVKVTNQTHAGSSNQSVKNSALDILKERYARGEIGKEEFEGKKKDIL